MAQILEFPSSQMQGLSFLEDQLRELLQGKGADEELVKFATSTVKEIYLRTVEAENYSFSLTLPNSASAEEATRLQAEVQRGIENIRTENHAIVVRLVAELALAVVKIFQQERRTSPR